MSKVLKYTVINGFKHYSPKVVSRYDDYPNDGFDLTEKFEKLSFWVCSRNRLLKSIVNKYSRQFNAVRFLEIGCGTGTFIQEIKSNKNIVITGSEIYTKGLLYAKKKHPDIELVQYDVKHGILDCTFDIIAAFDVIEHIDDDIIAISNVFDMLNEGGYFIVTVPQYKFLWSRLDEIVKHKRRYSRKDLLKKLRLAGFNIRYSSSFLFFLFPLMLINRIFDQKKQGNNISKMEFEKRVHFPKVLNWIFDRLMRIDEVLIKCGISLPFGGSIIVVAKK